MVSLYTGLMTRPDETGGSTVLLVDDDPDTRKLCAACLRKAGLTVTVAANGRDAQEVLRESPGSIALLITDVEMPFISGTELADSVAACGSSCPVLLISGKWPRRKSIRRAGSSWASRSRQVC